MLGMIPKAIHWNEKDMKTRHILNRDDGNADDDEHSDVVILTLVPGTALLGAPVQSQTVALTRFLLPLIGFIP